MNKSSLIGSILLLILPHTLQNLSNRSSSVSTVTNFFWKWSKVIVKGDSESKLTGFERGWLDNSGIYAQMYGNTFIGLILLILVLATIGVSIADEGTSAPKLLLISSTLIFFARMIELLQNNLFFYDRIIDDTYLEIPVASLVGWFFGVWGISPAFNNYKEKMSMKFKNETDFESVVFLVSIFPIFLVFVVASVGFNDGVNILINGIINGSSLALLALGFSIIFGVARMFKLSLGGYFVLGAYTTFWLNSASQLNVNSIIDAPTDSLTIFLIKLIIYAPLMLLVIGLGIGTWKLGNIYGLYFFILNIIALGIHREISVQRYSVFSFKATFHAAIIQSSIVLFSIALLYFELSKKQIVIINSLLNMFMVSVVAINPGVTLKSPSLYFGFFFLSILFVAIISMIVDRVALDQIRDSPTNVLIVTFGIALLIQSLIAKLTFPLNRDFVPFGVDSRGLDGVILKGDNIVIMDTPVQTIRIVAFIGSLVLITAVLLFLNYSQMGLAMKAVSQDRDASWLVGINVQKVYLVATALGMGLAAAAGILITPYEARPNWSIFMGWFPLIFAIAVVTVGGLGSIPGSVVAGFIIGFAQSYVSQSDPQNAIIVPFLVILVTMLIRPEGLFGIPEEEE